MMVFNANKITEKYKPIYPFISNRIFNRFVDF